MSSFEDEPKTAAGSLALERRKTLSSRVTVPPAKTSNLSFHRAAAFETGARTPAMMSTAFNPHFQMAAPSWDRPGMDLGVCPWPFLRVARGAVDDFLWNDPIPRFEAATEPIIRVPSSLSDKESHELQFQGNGPPLNSQLLS